MIEEIKFLDRGVTLNRVGDETFRHSKEEGENGIRN